MRQHHPLRGRRVGRQRGFRRRLLLRGIGEADRPRQIPRAPGLGGRAHPRGHLELFRQHRGDALHARAGRRPRVHCRERHLRGEADGHRGGIRRDPHHAPPRHAAQARCRIHDRLYSGGHPRRRRPRPVREDPGIRPVAQGIQGFQRPRGRVPGEGPGGDADGPRPRGLFGCVHALGGVQVEDAVQREREIRGVLRFRTGVRAGQPGPVDGGGRRELHPRAADRMRRPGRFQLLGGCCREARRFGCAVCRRQARRVLRPREHVPRDHPRRLRVHVHGVYPRDRSRRGPPRDAAQGQVGRRRGAPRFTRASSGPLRTLRRTVGNASPPSRDPGIRSISCTSVRCRTV